MTLKKFLYPNLIGFIILLTAGLGPIQASASGYPTGMPGGTFGRGAPLGSPFLIANQSVDTVYPAVAYDSQRQDYLAVWQNDRAGCDDIYGQRVSNNGALIGPWFSISAGCPSNRQNPTVAYNSQQDEFLVAWEHCGNGYDCGIRTRRVSGLGQVLDSTDIVVSTGTLGSENDINPTVGYAYTSNKYLLVWVQDSQSTYSKHIRGQVLSAAGVLEGSSFLISEDSGGGHARSKPDLAYNRSRNEYLVVWQQWASSDYDVYSRRVTGTGSLLYPESTAIINSGCDETTPAVGAIPLQSSGGGYLVAWENSCGGSEKDIRTRQVAGDGTPGTIVTAASSSLDESSPAVAGNENTGQYLVVWTTSSSAPSLTSSIHGVFASMAGSLVGQELFVGGLYADHAVVTSGPTGDFLTAFDDPLIGSSVDVWGVLQGNRLYLPLVRK
jgi:hypothetical protein